MTPPPLPQYASSFAADSHVFSPPTVVFRSRWWSTIQQLHRPHQTRLEHPPQCGATYFPLHHSPFSHQHWLDRGFQRDLLHGDQRLAVDVHHLPELLGPPPHPRPSPPATSLVPGYVRFADQRRRPDVFDLDLGFLFLSPDDPGQGLDHELEHRHQRRYHDHRRRLLLCQGQEPIRGPGCFGQARCLNGKFRVFRPTLEVLVWMYNSICYCVS